MRRARWSEGGELGAESESAATILAAALEAFVEHGFHGTSVREIAERADTAIAAMYYHFGSKHEMLSHIAVGVMSDVLRELQEAAAQPAADPAERLRHVVHAHASFNARRRVETFVTNTEIRSLGESERAVVVDLRDQVERVFREVINEGLADGVFTSATDPHELTRAIIGMSMHISEWYRSDGPLSPDEIAARYANLALDLVGWARIGSLS